MQAHARAQSARAPAPCAPRGRQEKVSHAREQAFGHGRPFLRDMGHGVLIAEALGECGCRRCTVDGVAAELAKPQLTSLGPAARTVPLP
jgi:hypothetical protein